MSTSLQSHVLQSHSAHTTALPPHQGTGRGRSRALVAARDDLELDGDPPARRQLRHPSSSASAAPRARQTRRRTRVEGLEVAAHVDEVARHVDGVVKREIVRREHLADVGDARPRLRRRVVVEPRPSASSIGPPGTVFVAGSRGPSPARKSSSPARRAPAYAPSGFGAVATWPSSTSAAGATAAAVDSGCQKALAPSAPAAAAAAPRPMAADDAWIARRARAGAATAAGRVEKWRAPLANRGAGGRASAAARARRA